MSVALHTCELAYRCVLTCLSACLSLISNFWTLLHERETERVLSQPEKRERERAPGTNQTQPGKERERDCSIQNNPNGFQNGADINSKTKNCYRLDEGGVIIISEMHCRKFLQSFFCWEAPWLQQVMWTKGTSLPWNSALFGKYHGVCWHSWSPKAMNKKTKQYQWKRNEKPSVRFNFYFILFSLCFHLQFTVMFLVAFVFVFWFLFRFRMVFVLFVFVTVLVWFLFWFSPPSAFVY